MEWRAGRWRRWRSVLKVPVPRFFGFSAFPVFSSDRDLAPLLLSYHPITLSPYLICICWVLCNGVHRSFKRNVQQNGILFLFLFFILSKKYKTFIGRNRRQLTCAIEFLLIMLRIDVFEGSMDEWKRASCLWCYSTSNLLSKKVQYWH